MNAPRLKLPAYGKQLLLDRRAGNHPLQISLVFGERWFEVPAPKLCLKPADYAPGQFNFSVVTGLWVTLHDQEARAADCDEAAMPPTYGPFYDLLTELAQYAAVVWIRWPDRLGWGAQSASGLAYASRWPDRAARRMRWPRWWSDELEATHAKRQKNWSRLAAECGERHAAAECA